MRLEDVILNFPELLCLSELPLVGPHLESFLGMPNTACLRFCICRQLLAFHYPHRTLNTFIAGSL